MRSSEHTLNSTLFTLFILCHSTNFPHTHRNQPISHTCSTMRGVFFLALITGKSTCGFREQSSPQLRQAGLESSTSSALTPTSSVTDTPSSSNNTTSDSDLANFGQTVNILGLARTPPSWNSILYLLT